MGNRKKARCQIAGNRLIGTGTCRRAIGVDADFSGLKNLKEKSALPT
jgi:hypothetical protein